MMLCALPDYYAQTCLITHRASICEIYSLIHTIIPGINGLNINKQWNKKYLYRKSKTTYMYEFFHQYPRLGIKVYKILPRLNCIHKYFENGHRDVLMKSSEVTKFLSFILENLKLLLHLIVTAISGVLGSLVAMTLVQLVRGRDLTPR